MRAVFAVSDLLCKVTPPPCSTKMMAMPVLSCCCFYYDAQNARRPAN